MELSTRPIARAAVAVALLIGLAAVVLNWAALTRPLPPGSDTGVFEQIFGVTPVLAAIRIGTVILISYIAGSLVALGLEGRLLVKAGPAGAEVDPDPALRGLKSAHDQFGERVGDLEAAVRNAWDSIDRLYERLREVETD